MPAFAKTPLMKATWLWDAPLIRASASDVLAFCRTNEVNAIYLQINREVHASDYGAFIRRASQEGIAVYALDGRTTWGFVANRPAIERSFGWLGAYQEAAAADERFAGLHVDIEPYALPYWDKTGTDFIAQWQDNVRYIVRTAKEMRLKVAASIPFWLNEYKTPDGSETLSRWMMRQYGAVTILVYRDSAQAMAEMVQAELAEAADLNVPATVGVETGITAEGSAVAWLEKDRTSMDEWLAEAFSLLNRHGTFAGIAIHDYKAWSGMER